MTKLHITWIKSSIGYAREQRRTLKALGFHRLNQTVIQPDCASIRGMINKVKHLVKVGKEAHEAG
ncbi:50S ribosomal protein L30 [Chloroflexota bacterium]